MSKLSEVVCWGELLWDLFDSGPKLGGAAANVAVHLARLGHHARLVSRVGNDELGRTAVERLAWEGVDVRDVQLDPDYPTGTVHVTLTPTGPTFRIGEQAAWDRIEMPRLADTSPATLGAIVFGTLAQRCPVPKGALLELLTAASPQTLRVCDLNLRPPYVDREVVSACLTHANVVKLNDTEADRLADLFSTTHPLELMLLDFDVSLVALTLGANGCRLISREFQLDAAPAPLLSSEGDSVGAGDAFTAVLTSQLLAGTPPADLAARANAYAAQICSVRGAFGPRSEPTDHEAHEGSVEA